MLKEGKEPARGKKKGGGKVKGPRDLLEGRGYQALI